MDINELMDYLFTPLSQIGLIIGLSEVIKQFGINSKFIPLIDLSLGVIIGICVYTIGMGYGLLKGTLLGIALGLQSCGLFSGFKNTIL